MRFVKYVLLALLGSSSAAGVPGTTPASTLGADSIVQPNGGIVATSQMGNRRTTKKDSGALSPAVRRKKGHTKVHKNWVKSNVVHEKTTRH